jgi:hypothetical protein
MRTFWKLVQPAEERSFRKQKSDQQMLELRLGRRKKVWLHLVWEEGQRTMERSSLKGWMLMQPRVVQIRGLEQRQQALKHPQKMNLGRKTSQVPLSLSQVGLP